MNAPMMGSWQVQVHAVHPYQIHGDQYFELHVLRTDDPAVAGQILSIKAPSHAFSMPPEPGQRLIVTFLMGQVTSARPLA